jgi:chromosome segregation ATPase
LPQLLARRAEVVRTVSHPALRPEALAGRELFQRLEHQAAGLDRLEALVGDLVEHHTRERGEMTVAWASQIRTLEEALRESRDVADALHVRHAEATGAVDAARREASRERDELIAAHAREAGELRNALAASCAEAEALHTRHAHATDAADAMRMEASREREELIETHTREVAELRAALDTSREEAHGLRADGAAALEELSECRAEAHALRAHAAETTVELNAEREENRRLSRRVRMLESHLKAARDQLAVARAAWWRRPAVRRGLGQDAPRGRGWAAPQPVAQRDKTRS